MKRPYILFVIGLLVILILGACSPATTPEQTTPQDVRTPLPQPTATQQVVESPTSPAPTNPPEVPSEPAAKPTSRGNQLAATDPSTVKLATGQPQLFEFFAFW